MPYIIVFTYLDIIFYTLCNKKSSFFRLIYGAPSRETFSVHDDGLPIFSV